MPPTSQDYARTQYATPARLNTRISIHEKYSVNRQGFGPWILEQYDLRSGMRVLELGCGTGSMWQGRLDRLGPGTTLLLSDCSPGMVAAAREALGAHPQVSYAEIDIQDIPFPAASFDAVIANMMLYHVPDLPRALTEVRRVLRPGGKFYCATYGEHGMIDYLSGLLPGLLPADAIGKAFTLQNGAEKLRGCFDQVERRDYPDALRVTDLDDLLDYLASLQSLRGLSPEDRERLRAALAAHMRDGALTIPKEYGLFICA